MEVADLFLGSLPTEMLPIAGSMAEAMEPELQIHFRPANATSALGLPYALWVTTDSTLDGNGSNFTSGPIITAGEDTPPWIVVLKSIFTVAIMSLAVFGNSLVITSVLKFEKLRIIANSFIVSLAFADLLVAILVMPFNASQEIAGKWVFGNVMCNIFNANDVLFSTASLLHLCCISMDRYIAITDPFHYESKMTKKRVGIMLLCAWGASGLISHVPIHLGWYTTDKQKEALQSDSQSCTFIVNKYYAVLSCFISFWTPTIIMVFTYVKIFREARRQEKQIYLLAKQAAPSLEHLSNNHITSNGTEKNGNAVHNRRLTQDRKKMRREHKAAKTLGVIMGAFICCWLPFFIWYLTSNLCDHCHTPPVVVSILFWVGYFNSALNPIIYAFFNRDFRFAFKRLLRCHKLHTPCCHCCYRRGPETNALAHYPHTGSGRNNKNTGSGGADFDHSSTPSPRSKKFYDTVEQPSI